VAGKPLEPDDPLALVGVALDADAGDEDAMARCLVEEYVRAGWTEERLLALFRNPFYRALHAIYRRRGEEAVRALIDHVAATWGVWRVTETVAPRRGAAPPEDGTGGPDDA
jgi:hypothetical protein